MVQHVVERFSGEVKPEELKISIYEIYNTVRSYTYIN